MQDGSVSRRHGVIEATPEGYRIRDLGSKNGTFVNGIQVQDATLPLRGTLRLGQVEIPFAQTEGMIDVALSRRTEVAGMVGQSPVMREIFATLERIGPTTIPVLLHGESGTGKELAARALHRFAFSDREAPFVVFDCSAVQRGLLESALFGHEEGAFSGAVEARPGAMEMAAGGTLFIDEIGELEPDMQPKLLRALDKGEFRRVGGTALLKSSARVVAATHQDLERSLDEGDFRHDLYFRLAGMKVEIPPCANEWKTFLFLFSICWRKWGSAPWYPNPVRDHGDAQKAPLERQRSRIEKRTRTGCGPVIGSEWSRISSDRCDGPLFRRKRIGLSIGPPLQGLESPFAGSIRADVLEREARAEQREYLTSRPARRNPSKVSRIPPSKTRSVAERRGVRGQFIFLFFFLAAPIQASYTLDDR